MCGIGGVKRLTGGAPIRKEQIQTLMCGLEHRGNDATGVAIQFGDGRIEIYKDNCPAWEMAINKDFKSFMDEHLTEESDTVLVHTRLATMGDTSENENNHPISIGRTAVVHNGMINNHSFVLKQLDLESHADVDSDVIRAILDKEGLNRKGVKQLNKLSGSLAAAAISVEEPDTLLLMRSGNPIILAFSDSSNQLLWASEMGVLHAALRPWTNKVGIWMRANSPDAYFTPIPRNTAWLFNKEGLSEHWLLDVASSGYREPIRSTFSGYKERQERLNPSRQEGDLSTRVSCNKETSIKGIESHPPSNVQMRSHQRIKCPGCQHKFQASSISKLGDLVRCGKCQTLLRLI